MTILTTFSNADKIEETAYQQLAFFFRQVFVNFAHNLQNCELAT